MGQYPYCDRDKTTVHGVGNIRLIKQAIFIVHLCSLCYVIFMLLSLHHFCMIRTIYSTWGLEVFRTIVSTSCRSSLDAFPAIINWKTPTQAPLLPSQYSGSGSNRSRTSKAFAAYMKWPIWLGRNREGRRDVKQ